MTCNNCGKELEYICDLTDEEKKDVDFVKTKFEILDKEVNNLNQNMASFDDFEKMSEYVHAVYNQIAETKVLDFITFNKILKDHNLDKSKDIRILDDKLWMHP